MTAGWKSKVYQPQVLEALAECLRLIYWFKKDLRSFLVHCGVDRQQLERLPWQEYKHAIVNRLVEDLSARGPAGTSTIEAILGGVVEQDESFPRLRKLEDGKTKAEEARNALRRLKALLGTKTVAERAEEAKAARRTEAERRQRERAERADTLKTLNDEFMKMFTMSDVKRRGLQFQDWLRRLFAIHDLEPRGSFASPGEQVDGSISLEGLLLLVEARWTDPQVPPKEVRDFVGKLNDKLDNTLGLMVAVNGFTENAGDHAKSNGRLMAFFMDGTDLMSVLNGSVDLGELLRRKRRHAAEKGETMYRVGS
jgi:hypothetical protein